MIEQAQQCRVCGRELPLSDFIKDRGYKNGYTTRCRNCDREYKKKYYWNNHEKIREYRKKIHKIHKDNPDFILWHKRPENIEKHRALCRKINARSRNKDNYIPWEKRSNDNMIRSHKNNKKRRDSIKERVFVYYGGKHPRCSCCGEDDINVLTIDHINNDGANHRESLGVKAGSVFYRWLVANDFPNDVNLQVLCFNCNLAKKIYGKCVHDIERENGIINNSVEELVNIWIKTIKNVSMDQIYKKRYRVKNKLLSLKYYSDNDKMACVECGETYFDFLTIDHIDNNGAEHRKTNVISDIYIWLKKNNYPAGFQTLCMNCNWKKRIRNINHRHYINSED